MKINMIIQFKQMGIIIILLLFFTLNLFAQNEKYEYMYIFKLPHIDCYYYHTQSASSTSLKDNNKMALYVRILDMNRNLDTNIAGVIQLITEGSGDTIVFELSEINDKRVEIPRQSFRFNVGGIYTCSVLKNKYMYIEDENTNEVSLTIVQGCDGLHSYYIWNKRELSREELQNICDDIIYGTKKSKLKKDEDYYLVVKL